MTGPASETASKARIAQWSNRLTQARLGGPDARIDVPPEDSALWADDEAYAVQDAILRAMNLAPGGWKIGSKSLDGPAQCAPLPACDVHRGPATLEHRAFAKPALELEVAFVLSRDFRAHGGPYDARTVLGSIATVHAAIEIVSSRYVTWPNVDKRLQLADLPVLKGRPGRHQSFGHRGDLDSLGSGRIHLGLSRPHRAVHQDRGRHQGSRGECGASERWNKGPLPPARLEHLVRYEGDAPRDLFFAQCGKRVERQAPRGHLFVAVRTGSQVRLGFAGSVGI